MLAYMLKHRICCIRNMLHHTIGYDTICYDIINYNTIGYDAIYCIGPPAGLCLSTTSVLTLGLKSLYSSFPSSSQAGWSDHTSLNYLLQSLITQSIGTFETLKRRVLTIQTVLKSTLILPLPILLITLRASSQIVWSIQGMKMSLLHKWTPIQLTLRRWTRPIM